MTVQYPPAAAGAGGVAIQGSGTAVVSNSTVQFANSNGLTFGLNGSTVTGSHNGITVQSAQTFVGALAAVGSTATSGTVSFSNSNGVSFGMNGQTITASVAAAAASPNQSFWLAQAAGGNNAAATLATRAWFWPINLQAGMPGAMTWNTMGLFMSGSTNVTTFDSHTISLSIGLYKLNNATQISLINSVLWTTGSAATASSYLSLYGGGRLLTIQSSQWSAQPTVSAGGSYWMGIIAATSGVQPALSVLGQLLGGDNAFFSGALGATVTSLPAVPWHGFYTAVTTALPTAISYGEVIHNTSVGTLYNGLMPNVAAAQGVSWF